jgi:hypothetical protein
MKAQTKRWAAWAHVVADAVAVFLAWLTPEACISACDVGVFLRISRIYETISG